MPHHDQASKLRDQLFDDKQETSIEEIDVLSLPSRSERHQSRGKEKQNKESAAINWHIWITRGIAFLFISLLVALIVYYTQGQWNIPTNTKEDNLLNIIR
ncbi:hypothetical protein [Alkalihalobacillus sp. AL-G]|uniref:hypothetical protein n=1 Tax=Alkalihalobacillus sp. AL-G TaxID=2926399 RepID=UPI00272A26E7|nr:hypothetical protein [Alkalihalobacillus sp. AL-G]WLD91859.1 hypothetical protein MOJ78_12500 [Alkalihalobacillus sp. AL-G]